jgi:hypothetical protein
MVKNLKNLIIIIVVLTAISIGGYFVYKNNNKVAEVGFLSAQKAAEKAMGFINQNMLPENITASLIEVVEDNGLYKFKLKVGEEEHTAYATKDGKLLFIDAIDMDQVIEAESPEPVATEVPKEEKPDVKLFVMSYCPFGLQAQKMFLSVSELLGEKSDIGIYFVNYIMHGEEEINENLIQYCIQKQEPQKFIDYLGCFVKDGDSQECLLGAKIDQGILAECIATTDGEYNIYSQYEDQSTWLNGQFPRFDVHTALNEQYGVRGSPTVVINGSAVEVSPRSPEQFKQVVCQSFNSPPEECQQNLSETAFSSGFGLEEGSDSGGDCGP